MQYPAQLYTASATPYVGIPEPHYPFHDKTVLVTCCGRICLHRKKINLSKSLAGQAVGIKEVDDGIWLVSSSVMSAPAVTPEKLRDDDHVVENGIRGQPALLSLTINHPTLRTRSVPAVDR